MNQAEMKRFLTLANTVANVVKANLTWEERYELIFNAEVSRCIFNLTRLDYVDPDMGYEDDVRAFARAVEEKAESVARQLKALCSAEKPIGKTTATYTLDEVFQMFKNLGIDTDCGACMGVAFTGCSFNEHSCGK